MRRSSETPRILEQENQLPLAHRRRLETKTTIKRFSLGIDGVRQQSSYTRLLSNRDSAPDGILQQAETRTLPLVVEIDSQPRQNNQRDRVLPHPATNPLRRLKRVDLANGQAEVSGDAIPFAHDEGSRRAATLSLACVAQQPFGERWFSAVKFFQPVTRIERLRCR